MPYRQSKSQPFPARLAAAALLLGGTLTAQQLAVPRDPLPKQNGDPALRYFDMQHLKDVPYNGSLPKPIYPSTERVQRAFMVEYVYDYAYSAYKPEVPVPIVSALQAKRNTPEDALIALFSAIRTGDYEAFVKSFDEASQTSLRALAKDKNQGAAYWQDLWKKAFGNKQMQLVDRIETSSYVILDTRFTVPAGSPAFPTAFKISNGQWVATNDLASSAILDNLPPVLAGEIIRTQPVPVGTLNSFDARQQQAQADFMKDRTVRDTTVHVGH